MLSLTFYISGLALAGLVVVKHLESKTRRRFILLNAISKGDEHARSLYQKVMHLYADTKERVHLLATKQIPLRTKSTINKSVGLAKESYAHYLNKLRNHKIIKRSDGLSEFFRSISEEDREKGEINDVFEEPEAGSQNE